MWVKLSSLIIKYRLALLIITGLITAFMAYKSKDIEMSYDYVKVIAEDDPDFIFFRQFKQTFGEDGNIFVIGMQNKSVFTLNKYKKFEKLTQDILKVPGINDVISIPTLKRLVKDTAQQKFVLNPIYTSSPKSQAELDSILKTVGETKFYEGILWNQHTNATLVAVSIDGAILNSDKRQEVVDHIMALCKAFHEETKIDLHYAGLPYVRAVMVKEVKGEFIFFLIFSVLVTSLILFFFFRSLFAVFFTFLVIVITVLWTMGTIVLLGYKMTLLTGILPALIIVISIPNCIYMYNKYHQEFKRHGNKLKAITRIIQKIGFLTFMTNANTAVGFLVLYFTNIIIIKEFGLVAGLISLATFFITIVVIPTLLFFLPPPNAKQLKHLDFGFLRKVNTVLELLVLRFRPAIYIIMIVFVGISLYGITRIKSVSYMVDDLPENSNVKKDLAFLEQHFNGIMPLEIVVDLGKKKAILKQSNLVKLEEFETYLKSLNNVSPPISILNIIKGSKQAYYNGNPDDYSLPSNRERPFILKYFGKGTESNTLLKAFVDSSGQKVRFTSKVADLGTIKMKDLIEKNIEPKAQEIFKDTDFKVTVTGTTKLFLKGNDFLIKDLTMSLVYAFILISLMMALMFTNIKMILISLIPNIIPMILTAGIMGLFNIPLKPSTALIFGISFGISIDSTIHYLSKYKQEMARYNNNVLQAVTSSLQEAGVSMIYTSIVLFCGFVIFAFSEFGGTIALGVLTSLTLFFAMFTNLLLLPSLLLSLSKGPNNNLFPIVSTKDKVYVEDDDEEIDLKKLEILKKDKQNTESEI